VTKAISHYGQNMAIWGRRYAARQPELTAAFSVKPMPFYYLKAIFDDDNPRRMGFLSNRPETNYGLRCLI
jgi:hypothetical protein